MRPATSEPKPGMARFGVKQPQAVCRLSGRRGPRAKEIFIGIHQCAHRKRKIQQEDKLGYEEEEGAITVSLRYGAPYLLRQARWVRRVGRGPFWPQGR